VVRPPTHVSAGDEEEGLAAVEVQVPDAVLVRHVHRRGWPAANAHHTTLIMHSRSWLAAGWYSLEAAEVPPGYARPLRGGDLVGVVGVPGRRCPVLPLRHLHRTHRLAKRERSSTPQHTHRREQ
jgi:hypothetical protein